MAEIDQLLQTVPFDIVDAEGSPSYAIESAILRWIVPSRTIVPPYWSRTRDAFLRQTWRSVDPFKVAVTTFVNKAVTIPISVRAKDRTVKRHVALAETFQNNLELYSGLMSGWKEEFKKFIIDYLTQDNGAFFLVMADSPVNEPIVGRPYGVYHLDSANCTRTGDPRYPVVYSDEIGNSYALHYSRVLYASNLPSPERSLYGVGLSAVSCALDAGIEIRDVYAYMQEKLGSRPKRQILYAKTGSTRDKLVEAIDFADDKMDSEGLSRFAKTVIMAPKNPNGQLDLGIIDLASTPDNFNRMDVQLINISVLAGAFGLDVQDLAVSYGVGTAVRSTEVQERKGRGKGVGELLETVSKKLNQLFLPPTLQLAFDNQDDSQDEQQAKIWDMRSTARQRDLTTGSTTVQMERARMLRNGEITEDEYAQMELIDGRLSNGVSVVSLFYSKDSYYSSFLDFGVENVMEPQKNDVESILTQIIEKEKAAYLALETAPTANINRKLMEILAALSHLKSLYRGYQEQLQLTYEQEMGANEIGETEAIEAEEEGIEAEEEEIEQKV